VRQRHAEAEVGRHRALARQQAAQQRIGLQVRKSLRTGRQQLLQRALQRDAVQVDDAAPGDDFVEPHGLKIRIQTPRDKKSQG
jgi:hypothetical protein